MAIGGAAHAGTISDAYLGGTGGGNTIGGSTYNLTQASITRSGSVLNIVINTSFAGAAKTIYNSANQAIKVGYGDLFLSNVWNPSGTAGTQYSADNMSTSNTIWKYGVAIDSDRYTTGAVSNAAVSLYQLNAPAGATTAANINAANINTSDAVLSAQNPTTGVIYRAGQADTVKPGATAVDTGANGLFGAANGQVSFQIDIKNTDMMNWTSFAMHWGDTTQNIVIEGATRVVPEPGSMALFGLAAAGLLAARRRKTASSA